MQMPIIDPNIMLSYYVYAMRYQNYGEIMKKIAFIILSGISLALHTRTYQPNHNLFYANTFNNHATAWVNAYVFDRYGNQITTDIELQYVANLMYFSYRRSQETVRAQQAALETLQGVWHGWQNIAKRRLNPSNTPPYYIDVAHEVKKSEDFWRQYALHQRISCTYDHTVTNVVYGGLLTNQLIVQGVKDMRTEARKVMLDAMTDIKQHLGNLFDYAFNKRFRDDQEIIRGIGDFVMSYIPQLAVNSFTNADALHNTVSDDTWQMLYTVQTVGVQTWQAIEQARMAFYKAHYTHLYRTMQRLRLNQPYFAIVFGDHGSMSLPNPNSL